MPLKPAPDIVWCPSRLHRCSRYNHRTTFQNHSPRASTSINTRLRRASMPLKPAPDIVWCPSRLHSCSRYNHRTTFQNDSPRLQRPLIQAEGFIPIEARSRHRLVSVSVTKYKKSAWTVSDYNTPCFYSKRL